MGTVRGTLPDSPLIFTIAVPVVAVALAVKVTVLLPVAGLGLNAAVTPAGRLVAESVTLPVNPSAGVMVMLLAPVFPCGKVRLAGLAVRM
jgi:hypothetical protein